VKHFGSILGTASLLLLLASCMATPLVWRPEALAVNLNIEAAKMLNVRGGEAHPLAVCVYQLRDQGAFRNLTGGVDGLYKLLECTPFDSSVAGVRRVVVNPGESRKVSLDREEGARFVGIVAGYYNVDGERIVRLFSIPVQTEGVVLTSRVPAPLNVTLRLGSKGILPFRAE
jgi:type VI secretion system VasD/TssJ family lipoprotein